MLNNTFSYLAFLALNFLVTITGIGLANCKKAG